MRRPESKHAITRARYDTVLFGLEDAVTDTATIHAAWKQLYEAYLQQRAAATGEPFRPCEIATDYQLYVDGKPRFDGVRDFLASRGLRLPEGTRDDPPQAETVGGLGNRQNALVNDVIDAVGVGPYAGSVKLLHQPRREGFKLAVVTVSQNCEPVLKAAKLEAFFEVRQVEAEKPPNTAAHGLGREPMASVRIGWWCMHAAGRPYEVRAGQAGGLYDNATPSPVRR